MKIDNENKPYTGKKEVKKNNIFQNSILIKLITITVLMLLLLIPSTMIESIIKEREQLNEKATTEVSDKWAGGQQINGPILTIPLIYEDTSGEQAVITTQELKVLPENLTINGKVNSEKLKRGIYEVVVYKSDFDVSGNFKLTDIIDTNNLKKVDYDNAFLSIGISDLRGIKNRIQVKVNNQELNVKPGSKIPTLIPSGVMAKLENLKGAEQLKFSYQLKLNGSKKLEFIPTGGNTEIKITSDWNSPSFNGKFLPDAREISEDGFTAEWKILQLNKNLPTNWIEGNIKQQFNEAAFGVDLILPLDDYQKSMRSAKYAVLTIALTFLIFFLVEITNKRKIHPFQYALVGLAICLFYILLVSISEHSNFNLAYGISTLGIVGLIVLYSLTIFQKKRLSALLMLVLTALFGFLFVTLQLADFALLMGSIGLLIILAITMYATRNIDWYKINLETNTKQKEN